MPTRFRNSGLIACLLLILVSLPSGEGDCRATGHFATTGFHHVQLDTPELDTNWRYTRYGWQDSSQWSRAPIDMPSRGIERVSPILISLDILLASAAAMIWASDEREVARLFGRKTVPSSNS